MEYRDTHLLPPGGSNEHALVIRAETVLSFLSSVHEEGVQAFQVYPTIWIEAENRPDIASLWHVHFFEGDGRLDARWTYQFESPAYFLLTCELHTPVRTAFSLPFSLPRYASFLNMVAHHQRLTLIAQAPPPWLDYLHTADVLTLPSEAIAHLQGVTIAVASDELGKMLEYWQKHVFSQNV